MVEELHAAYLYKVDDALPNLAPAPANDRRVSEREVVNDLCFLVINIRGRKVTALVRDITNEGAKIETTCFELPDHFILDNQVSNMRVVCRKVWSRDGLSGVIFVPSKHN